MKILLTANVKVTYVVTDGLVYQNDTESMDDLTREVGLACLEYFQKRGDDACFSELMIYLYSKFGSVTLPRIEEID